VPPIEPPVLRDRDLVLRAPRPADAEAVAAACQDAAVQRWVGVPSPYRIEHAQDWIAGAPGRARTGTMVGLLAFSDGHLAGSFSLMEIDLGRAYGEIGYWVSAQLRGRRIATRAVGLLRAWGHGALGLATVEILVHRDNAPSRGVAERAGFADTGELRRAPRREDHDEPSYVVYAWNA
jgi:RimJ/RimL family protein N-acetyltransferase